jgi:hypothetical protein
MQTSTVLCEAAVPSITTFQLETVFAPPDAKPARPDNADDKGDVCGFASESRPNPASQQGKRQTERDSD